MKSAPHLRVAISGFLALLAWQAQAAVSSETSLTNLRFEVVDLNAADGVAASFAVADRPINTLVELSAGDISNNVSNSDSWQSPQWMAANAQSVSSAASTASAASGLGFLASSGTASTGGGSFAAYAAAPYFNNSEFTLSAHTRLVVSGDAMVRVSIGARAGPGNAFSFDEVVAAVGVYAYVSDTVRSEVGYNHAQTITLQGEHEAFLYDQTFAVTTTIVNDSDSAMTGLFYAYSSTRGSMAASPVPEPGTHALLWLGFGLGLGMQCLRAWRQRRGGGVAAR
jgi:hypothetical protein